jgi:hypothetical protein
MASRANRLPSFARLFRVRANRCVDPIRLATSSRRVINMSAELQLNSTAAALEPSGSFSKSLAPFRRKTWADAAGQREVSARLDHLPEGLAFGEDFPEPIRFDPASKQLVYRGFMSYGSFHYLWQFHSDPAYGRALDELFTLSSGPRETRRSRWPLAAFIAVAAVIAAAAALLISR